MWKLILIVLLALLPAIICYSGDNLQPRPQPMKNFIAQKVTGRWYVQARYITCSFAGARGFTDGSIDIKLVEKKYFEVTNTHRSGTLCPVVVDKRLFKPEAGTYAVQFLKDVIGNMYSGERIITATDYKKFMIVWSCMEFSQEKPNFCDDPGMSVYTRERVPSPYVERMIDEVLKAQFQIRLNSLEKMKHDNPC